MAVSAQRAGEVEGGVTIFVAPLFGGVRGKDTTADVSVSRKKFSVPLSYLSNSLSADPIETPSVHASASGLQ